MRLLRILLRDHRSQACSLTFAPLTQNPPLHTVPFPVSSRSPERASTSAIFCDAAGHFTKIDPLLRSTDDADAIDAEVGEQAVRVLTVAPSRDVKFSRRPTSVELRAIPNVVGSITELVDVRRVATVVGSGTRCEPGHPST